jgi:2-oxoglutarate/2-oxoacid ferredoxin oxidoreductase subunit beta
MIDTHRYDMPNGTDIAWCPACGNYPILTIVKQAFAELGISPDRAVMCSGIGQAAKMPQYLRINYFNGLHGRALPPAVAIKVANPELTVIAESGDGDTYGEGGNHFLHTIRRNPDITNIVHDNMIYGLTKGQASPTSSKGMKNPIQPNGVVVEPFNPIALAIANGATFVARANAGDIKESKEIVKSAILHKGYALVDILQPCVIFNKINTYQWFKEHTYYLDENYRSHDRMEALRIAFDLDRLALGIIYQQAGAPTYETLVREGNDPLHTRHFEVEKLRKLITSFR